ncbi:DNA mismatch repair protein MutH [Mesocricetibacter intestinalis]|uniref:DNA mismatch repair protein MutH n=1 Tax=Mesocricetibacter intestinalis TaxID=1521930 RepID=A0A4R6V8P3_9PAST|nr:DNA mismatch repair endonuclease MutH [Mesocricetibacter intestinalis]TDQ57948.1 DNA mismatch repair protein MutH [Mesocricetibacter intestinalis]
MTVPHSEQELLDRAKAIAGLKLAELAQSLKLNVPPDLKRDKGWVGTLIERALGADAGSKPEQDFPHLGIELKTIPINGEGYPLETTFVSLAPLIRNSGIDWRHSHLRAKLSKVLWIPVQGERSIPLGERYIGSPILWQPDPLQEAQLQRDWEELMDYIVLGKVGQIHAGIGEVLQLRPKGANRRARTKAVDERGRIIDALPLGFYLRKNFTARILQNFLQNR